MSRKIIFAGNFNPITIGHTDIINRAISLFGNITIAVSKIETGFLSCESRLQIIQDHYHNNTCAKVTPFSGLISEFALKEKAQFLLRGIRDCIDFSYEYKMASLNKEISGIETIFLSSSKEFSNISSTLIREIFKNGGDLNKFVPKSVINVLKKDGI